MATHDYETREQLIAGVAGAAYRDRVTCPLADGLVLRYQPRAEVHTATDATGWAIDLVARAEILLGDRVIAARDLAYREDDPGEILEQVRGAESAAREALDAEAGARADRLDARLPDAWTGLARAARQSASGVDRLTEEIVDALEAGATPAAVRSLLVACWTTYTTPDPRGRVDRAIASAEQEIGARRPRDDRAPESAVLVAAEEIAAAKQAIEDAKTRLREAYAAARATGDEPDIAEIARTAGATRQTLYRWLEA